jgi:hypothetical protein
MAPSLPAYPQGENKFRLSMTLSMIMGVSVLSVLIYKDVRKNYKMAVPLVAMKFASVFSRPASFAVLRRGLPSPIL